MSDERASERSRVEAIVSEQLRACSPALRQAFDRIRIPVVEVPIERSSGIEQAHAVAQRGESLLFWEDEEEGFEWARPDGDGVIRSFGTSQYELLHILTQFGLELE